MLLNFIVKRVIAQAVKTIEKKSGLEHAMACSAALNSIHDAVNAYLGRGTFTKKNLATVKSNCTYWLNMVSTVD